MTKIRVIPNVDSSGSTWKVVGEAEEKMRGWPTWKRDQPTFPRPVRLVVGVSSVNIIRTEPTSTEEKKAKA